MSYQGRYVLVFAIMIWINLDSRGFKRRMEKTLRRLTLSTKHFIDQRMAESLGQQAILLTGPVFFGIVFNWALLGALIVQVYHYFTNDFKDSLWIRAYVIVLFGLDMLQTAFSTQDVWQLLILDWGNSASLGTLPWTSLTIPIMSGIIAALVQIFFARRIYILKPGWFGRSITAFIVLTALMQSTSAIAFAIQWGIVGPEKGVHLVAGCTVWLAGSAACDVMITIGLYQILHSAKNRAFSRTNRMLNNLISRAIQSGVFTTMFAVVELVLFLTESGNFLHVLIALFLSKLYSNVLMANLNARKSTFNNSTDITVDHSLNSTHHLVSPTYPLQALRNKQTDLEMKPGRLGYSQGSA